MKLTAEVWDHYNLKFSINVWKLGYVQYNILGHTIYALNLRSHD